MINRDSKISLGNSSLSNSIQELLSDDRFQNFVSIIHDFTIQISKANSAKEIYEIITLQLASRLNLSDCVIYEVDEQTKKLEQVAAYGPKNKVGNPLKNKLILDFAQGHAGLAAQDKKSILIENCFESNDYVEDLEIAGSEIEVPIIHNNKVYAVISSENKEIGFYNGFHLKLFEILASITASHISKLSEKLELNNIKLKLEEIVKKKSNDLDMVVESLSDQYTALKHSHEKRDVLLQEVHHRVNNNLQVISSILNLYSKLPNENPEKTLSEVHKRVQAMALIHQNFYKSFEQNLVNVKSYFNDLLNHLKSFSSNRSFTFELNTAVTYITINNLVPVGLLVTECVSSYFNALEEIHNGAIKLSLSLEKDTKSNLITLLLEDDLEFDLCGRLSNSMKKEESVSEVLIAALLDQINGELSYYFTSNNNIQLTFPDC